SLPTAKANVQTALDVLDQMIGKRTDKGNLDMALGATVHPGFQDYVGATYKPGMRFVEGSNAASYQALHKQVTGQAFLDA
ncbi:hypothetical protein, partial [Streptococcus pneumoniae]|uniref:hypothetical protein n=1 Tax=Streptococcus pneumoniae TaxID=1313 RepID=UPI0018B09027